GGELPRTPCAFSLGPHARRRGAQAPGDLHDRALPRWQPLPRGVPADRRLLAARPGRPRGGGACGDRALRGGARGVLPQRSVQLVQLLRLLARGRRDRRCLGRRLRERAWSGRVRRGARPAGALAALAFAVAFAAAGTAHRGHRTYLMPLRDYPQVAPFIESIRATLAGDREALERLFRVGFEGSLAHWSLLLVPTDARFARAVREIRIEGERDAIRSVD